MYTQKSFNLTTQEARAEKKWYLIDGTDKVVGRLATEIADILRGKNNPKFTPHIDSGDYVVLVNSDKIKFTGNKLNDKTYYWHTGFIGGIKSRTAAELMEKDSTQVIQKAVKGMLQKNALGRKQLKKFKIFAGNEHTHEAQNLEKYEF